MTRSSPWTIAAVAVVAYAACDMIHEVLGHGTATLLSKDVTAAMLTTVALSTIGSSRMVAAAGTIANVAAAGIAFALLRRSRGSSSFRYFLWLLASLDLMNGTGYLLFSGASGFGDWAVALDGLAPPAVWRAGLVVAGAVAYAFSVSLCARSMPAFEDRDVPRLACLPYWVGGILFVAGSAMNPISPWLILSSGASSGFGAMAGLLVVPRLARPAREEERSLPLGFQARWIVAAILVAIVFVFVIGRGIAL